MPSFPSAAGDAGLGVPIAGLVVTGAVLLAVALLVWFIATYNQLVRRRNQVQAS